MLLIFRAWTFPAYRPEVAVNAHSRRVRRFFEADGIGSHVIIDTLMIIRMQERKRFNTTWTAKKQDEIRIGRRTSLERK